MVYKFHITHRQYLLLLVQPIIIYIGVIAATYWYYKTIPFFTLKVAILCIFCLDTLPALILHIQYFLANKSSLFVIDKVKRTILYKSSRMNTGEVSFNAIKSLEYHVSYGRSTGVYSFARYRYYKINLNNSDKFIITCLMINDIENTLPMLLEIKAEKELSFFPAI
jgi:hypothetical protein